MTKLKKFRLFSIAVVLLLCVGLIALLPPLRLDLTEDGLYTLSDGTKSLLSRIEGDPLRLTLFYSDKVTENMPPLRAYARRVSETLREYEIQGKGKIVLNVVDPEPFSEIEDQAAAIGLQAVPGSNNDTIYFGLLVEGGDGKREVIAFFNPDKEKSLEYDISQVIYRISRPEPVVVGVISDLPIFQHRSMSSRQTIKPKIILEQLREMFDIKRMYDNRVEKIDDEIDLLMVVHPHLWPEPTLYAIDQFVLRGGRLLVFMDPDAQMDESEKALFGGDAFQDKSSSLEQLLTAWGVQYDSKKILLDYGFAHSIPVTQYGQALPHVSVLGISDEGFNRNDAITAGVDQVNLATSGAMSPIEGASTRFTPLMQSSADAQLMDTEEYSRYGNHGDLLQAFIVNKQGSDKQVSDKKGQYAIAAYVSGSAQTAFPQGKPGSKDKNQDENQLMASQQDISVVLFADTDILDDRMWVQVEDFYGQPVATPWASNSDLIVNVLEKLSGSEDLINVRSRGTYNRPFDRVNQLEKNASERFRIEQENLQNRLAETEQKIMSLTNEEQQASGEAVPELTPEQNAEVEKFQQERLVIRKKLREVQHQLNSDIEQLGSLLKVINILAVPVVLCLLALGMALAKRRRISSADRRRNAV